MWVSLLEWMSKGVGRVSPVIAQPQHQYLTKTADLIRKALPVCLILLPNLLAR